MDFQKGDEYETKSRPHAHSDEIFDKTTADKMSIRFENWKGTKATSASECAGTYDIKIQYVRKPHFSFSQSESGLLAGTVTFHVLKPTVDVTVGEDSFVLDLKHGSTGVYEYDSPALNGSEMTWNIMRGSKGLTLICHNDNADRIARLVTSHELKRERLKDFGCLEFIGPQSDDEKMKVEILIVAFTIGYIEIMRSPASGSGSGMGLLGAVGGAVGT